MQFQATSLQDVKLIQPQVWGDDRGFFYESWRQDEYDKQLGGVKFVQENHSRSARGVLRGLHFQNPYPQGKLVRVTLGSVYDVIVDLRKDSPTYGKWEGYELSDQNKTQLWVPPGFAHGFYVTTEYVEFVYKCTEYYHAESEHVLLWNDPELNITWPLINNTPPTVSIKDAAGKNLTQLDTIPTKCYNKL